MQYFALILLILHGQNDFSEFLETRLSYNAYYLSVISIDFFRE